MQASVPPPRLPDIPSDLINSIVTTHNNDRWDRDALAAVQRRKRETMQGLGMTATDGDFPVHLLALPLHSRETVLSPSMPREIVEQGVQSYH